MRQTDISFNENWKGRERQKITHKLFVIIVSINLLEFLRLTGDMF